jgi:hypothetical protein
MSSRPLEIKRVLAIDPISRGFGFVVFEGPEQLVDWSVVETKEDKETRGLCRVADLFVRYRPNVLVLEDLVGRGSRRCRRVRKLLDKIERLADKESISVRRFARAKVRRAFSDSGAKTKFEIATAIAKRFPELQPRLPRFRKPWMTEDDRMSIFDAASFALSYLHFAGRRKRQL